MISDDNRYLELRDIWPIDLQYNGLLLLGTGLPVARRSVRVADTATCSENIQGLEKWDFPPTSGNPMKFTYILKCWKRHILQESKRRSHKQRQRCTETVDLPVNRRRFLKWGSLVAAASVIAVGAAYHEFANPTSLITTTISKTTTYPTSTTSSQPLSDYLKGNGVSSSVADMASAYGALDKNKKELGDLVIKIKEFEPYLDTVERYQKNLLGVLIKEDPNDISAERLGTLRYMFSDKSLLINMLEFCMYPEVFDYMDTVNSKYSDVDRRIVYATLGIPRFKQVDKNKDTFETVMQRATDQQFKPAFNQMLSEGNVDKAKYNGYYRQHYSGFCTPIESLVWELLDDDRKADSFLRKYDMKALVSDAFRNTKASGNYRSEEWASVETAANRLGFNSWICWKWVKDNMRYDKNFPACCGDDRSLQEIYVSKRGVCRHAAYFTLHVLERGAVPAGLLAIHFQQNGDKWHAVTVEKKE